MFIKKLILILLALQLVSCLYGCKDKHNQSDTQSSEQTTVESKAETESIEKSNTDETIWRQEGETERALSQSEKNEVVSENNNKTTSVDKNEGEKTEHKEADTQASAEEQVESLAPAQQNESAQPTVPVLPTSPDSQPGIDGVWVPAEDETERAG